uniref:Pentacotripeptide-repeat region of PRORP domain-containing protein n=1 Tax=Oryza brachyantha TaxID=4533 RepID=J3KWL4_ORYBR
MAELQRQGHWSLALAALHVARDEPWYRPDPALYATFVSSSPASEDGAAAVDALVEAFLEEKERGGGFVEGEEDVYKLTRLVRALVAKGRARAAWRVYEAAGGMGGCEVDEYMYRVMARGMKRLGLGGGEEAAEVKADFREWEARTSSPAGDLLDEMRAREEQHKCRLTVN